MSLGQIIKMISTFKTKLKFDMSRSKKREIDKETEKDNYDVQKKERLKAKSMMSHSAHDSENSLMAKKNIPKLQNSL